MMPDPGKKPQATPKPAHYANGMLALWQIRLEGDWSRHETYRILNVFQRLSEQSGGKSILEIFNGQSTTLHRSGRPGRVGRTRGQEIFLDEDWTDWTFAHELGHRWNNAWDRQPEKRLQRMVGAGRNEWLRKVTRRLIISTEKALNRLGITARLDWRALWYHPGEAPPPCGVDRNFNASEDLAESFAAMILQEDAQKRARRAVERMGEDGKRWDWPSQFQNYPATPRGQSVALLLKNLPAAKENLRQTN